MKKFFVIAALLLTGFTASAQLNVGAGYMWDFWSLKDGSQKDGTYNMSGVYAGLSYNINIVEGLGIAPGAYFSWATGVMRDENGNKAQDTISGITGKIGTTDMELTVPVHITYSMDLGAGKAFAYLGPAFQYGLSMKTWTKFSAKNSAHNEISENLFAKDKDSGVRLYNPFDVKLGVGFGYNWKFIQANVGFDFGFLNRAKTSSNDNDGSYKMNANAVHAGVAFVF